MSVNPSGGRCKVPESKLFFPKRRTTLPGRGAHEGDKKTQEKHHRRAELREHTDSENRKSVGTPWARGTKKVKNGKDTEKKEKHK